MIDLSRLFLSRRGQSEADLRARQTSGLRESFDWPA